MTRGTKDKWTGSPNGGQQLILRTKAKSIFDLLKQLSKTYKTHAFRRLHFHIDKKTSSLMLEVLNSELPEAYRD
jgi:hypothetical protein